MGRVYLCLGQNAELPYYFPMVIMEQVAGNPGSLGLPVQPYPPVAVVDMVAAYHCVNGAVQFDTAQFRAAELPVCIDMMDLIPFNQ